MTRIVRNGSAGAPMSTERRPPPLATSAEPRSPAPTPTTIYDAASFEAGQDCGTRVAACLAHLSALELIDGSRWWNRWRRRLMAAALVAHAEVLESAADGNARRVSLRPRSTDPKADLRSV